MQVCLLVQDHMLPIPKDIKIVQNFGKTTIIVPNIDEPDLEETYVTADHIFLEGDKEHFIEWLKPFDGIWVGQGIPQMEQFTIMHIK